MCDRPDQPVHYYSLGSQLEASPLTWHFASLFNYWNSEYNHQFNLFTLQLTDYFNGTTEIAYCSKILINELQTNW
jgi:hypothetical protein